MRRRRSRPALLALLLLAPLLALGESWDAGEVAAAERFRAEEAARAAAYRERVAQGELRSAAAPMPRDAPQTPDDASGDEALRGAEDLVDLLERWLGGERAEPAPRGPERDTQRQRARERRQREADAWWQEEERRLEGEP